MKKDVIYIDLEDDITAIISKVNASAEKIVALVPPKRTGVLQSAVNLKLLQKGGLEKGKRIVLITNDKSLIALAAGIKLPVAKNLQSKPEIPTVASPDLDENDVINGADLPVGDFANKTNPAAPTTPADDISNKVDFADQAKPAPTPAKKAAKGSLGSKIKIPDFNTFRKKLFLIGGGVVLLVIFLIWALVIAPTATITINAKTTAVNIDRTLSLRPDAEASKPAELMLKPTSKQVKKSASAEFDATGTKQIGEKAKGNITINNAQDSDAVNVPAGTTFTAANGKTFTSTTGATVPGAKVVSGQIQPGQTSVSVTATAVGPDYNVAPQAYTISGYGNLSASGDTMSGGTSQEVKVVSQGDVDKAKDSLSQQDAGSGKDELRKQFGSEYIIIEESFTTETGSPAASPAVGEQAQKGKVTVETTYTMLGLQREDAKQIIGDVLKDALDDKPNQSIFSDGSNTISFQAFQKSSNGTYSARLVTTGYIGTTIDTKKLAEEVKGKRYGEIEQIANSITGVDKVDIKFSPFWVTSAPSNTDKINIRFTVVNDAN